MTLENYTGPQSNSIPSKEHKLNSKSLDQLVQEFPKEEDCSLQDITKIDPLLLKVGAGTEIDSMLYVLPYSSPSPFIMKATVII